MSTTRRRKRGPGRPRSKDPKGLVTFRIDGRLRRAALLYRRRHRIPGKGSTLAIRHMMERVLREEGLLPPVADDDDARGSTVVTAPAAARPA